MGEKITIRGRQYEKFIPWPRAIRDGTVRCISCGQIDEPAYHDDAFCPALGALSPTSDQPGDEG